MRTTRSRLARGSAFVAVVVAASTIISATAQAVSGVSPVPAGTYLFTAKIQNDLGACSAALVDPTWVITTTNCLTSEGQPVVAGPPTRPTTVTVGRTDLTSTGGHVLSVTSLVPHPSRNVVLAQLDRPAKGVTPIALGTAATVGEQLMAAGFGRTATEWSPNQLHAGAFAVSTVAGQSLTIDGTDAATTLCKGDAGGPLVRAGSGAPQLVALHDRSWQGGCLAESETRRTATEVRVDDLGGWIAQNTRNSYVALATGGALLDTRSGVGAPAGPRTGGSTIDVQALGVGGVPATAVTAVLVDVTAIKPTTNAYLIVYPGGSTRPATSSINASAGETISTTQVVKVGPNGKLSVYSQGDSTHVRIDVHGYFTNSGGGGLVALPHTRVVDTRDGTGTTTGTIPSNGSRTVTLTGDNALPVGASNALLEVTVVGATGGGYLTASPTGGTADPSSVLDYASGITSQGVAVKLSPTGQVTFVNRGPAVHLVMTLQGYVAASPTMGADLRPTQAVQVVDTRANGGAPIKAKGGLFINLSEAIGLPPNAMDGALISITAISPTSSGFLTVEPDRLFVGTPEGGLVVTNPSVSNFTAGHLARTTMVVTKVGRDVGGPFHPQPGKIGILNASSGTVHVVVTLHGWFNEPAVAGS
ncbi:trypsin-like serine protease [Micromonospora arborensis]|uniref:S1 family peptidase n=1 Tax=Micromonospora arborensis TaxID=2116518 RepID=UPI0033F1C60F